MVLSSFIKKIDAQKTLNRASNHRTFRHFINVRIIRINCLLCSTEMTVTDDRAQSNTETTLTALAHHPPLLSHYCTNPLTLKCFPHPHIMLDTEGRGQKHTSSFKRDIMCSLLYFHTSDFGAKLYTPANNDV